MALLFKHQGMSADNARTKAADEWWELKGRLDSTQCVLFYDYLEVNADECIPVPALIQFLREKKLVPIDLVDFLDRSVATVVDAPILTGPDNWDEPVGSLQVTHR